MKSIILASGNINKTNSIAKGLPKPLLTIKGKPIIEHILDKLSYINIIDSIYIVTNSLSAKTFETWLHNYPGLKPIKLIDDGSVNVKDCLGAIGDIELVIKKEAINDDLLVIGGDNMFSFSLKSFIEKASANRSIYVGSYYLNGRFRPNQFGALKVNGEEVVEFTEKSSKDIGSLVSMCLYFFPKEKLSLFSEYIKDGNSGTPGNYISWALKKDKVYSFQFEGNWCDVSDIDDYTEAVLTF